MPLPLLAGLLLVGGAHAGRSLMSRKRDQIKATSFDNALAHFGPGIDRVNAQGAPIFGPPTAADPRGTAGLLAQAQIDGLRDLYAADPTTAMQLMSKLIGQNEQVRQFGLGQQFKERNLDLNYQQLQANADNLKFNRRELEFRTGELETAAARSAAARGELTIQTPTGPAFIAIPGTQQHRLLEAQELKLARTLRAGNEGMESLYAVGAVPAGAPGSQAQIMAAQTLSRWMSSEENLDLGQLTGAEEDNMQRLITDPTRLVNMITVGDQGALASMASVMKVLSRTAQDWRFANRNERISTSFVKQSAVEISRARNNLNTAQAVEMFAPGQAVNHAAQFNIPEQFRYTPSVQQATRLRNFATELEQTQSEHLGGAVGASVQEFIMQRFPTAIRELNPF